VQNLCRIWVQDVGVGQWGAVAAVR